MTKTNTQYGFRNYAAIALVVFLSMIGIKGIAQPLLVENFDYTIGALLTDHDWTAHSGGTTEAINVTNGLIFSGYAGSETGIGGAANLDNNGQDVNKLFPEQTTGTVYCAAIVQPTGTGSAGYFMHFGQTTISTTFFTRVWTNATGDGIGLGQGSAAPLSYVTITGGTPVLVVIKLNLDTKLSSLYVLSSYQATEPATPDGTFTETGSFTNAGCIALRQYNASERVIVDGIRVAKTWADAVAPSSGSSPVISASPGTLSGFVYGIGNGPSDSQSYNLSGADLTPASGNITVTPSANYEISLNNTTFGQAPVNVAYTVGALASTPIYVRLKAGLVGGTYNGEIISNAGGGATTANVTCNGVVEAPASTTLPYSEDFATGFGLCYTKSVSGPAQYWKHSAANEYAYMNGYNTGVLEEDWMILPAVNFNDYSNISMSFDSYMNYGSDDADNYFKLVYSTNYAGIGDPTSATWTELTFNYPVDLSTWTPSGTINLSTITGSSVYIAFKYHYNAGFYRSWQIDNISVLAGSTPVITVNPATLSGFSYVEGSGPSSVKTYQLSAANLVGTGSVLITTPDDYEISANGTTFAAFLTYPFASGVITGQPVTVSVRLKAGLPVGEYNDQVLTHTGGTAATTYVTCNGQVQDPNITTIPYTEDFTTGLGLCTPVSVAGDTKFWVHNATLGYASMNGFNSGVLEEDWLILPGFDLNATANVGLNFSSWMNFGIDDADNYLKLLYSTDYPGAGDPTPYTWTELSFAHPAAFQIWTPSGTVDLSAISGSSVFIAFKYHYTVGFYRSWQLDNLEVAVMEDSQLTVTPATLNGFTYLEGAGPSAVQTYQLSGSGLSGSGNITVTAPADYEISSDGTTFVSSLNYPFAAGVVTGQPVTVSVRLKAGLAIGSYNAETIINAGGGATDKVVTCNGSVVSAIQPAIVSETVPQWIQGASPNNQRLPFAYRAGFNNLTPNATYRYINQAVIASDLPTAGGAGNPIYVNADGTFTRTSSTSFSTPGGYGEFTTNASGEFTGWFITESTANARFTPGNSVFMRISLNDGNGGTSAVTRLTTTSSAGVINFGVTSDVLQGTGIRCISTATPKNFVFIYDNEAGTGRPLYGSSIETTGVDFTTIGSYADFYETNVQGVDGSWGGIVPNVNANGVKLIEERSLTTGAVVNTNTSADGVWGTTDTRNPIGGDVNVLVIDLTGGTTPLLTASPTVLNGFTYIEGAGPSAVQTYQLSGTNLTGSGNITATAPVDYEISSDGTSFVSALSFPFAAGVITGQPVTVSVRLKAGLAIGSYNAETIINAGGGATDKVVTCNGSVTSATQPEIATEMVPQWIQGVTSNNQRLPFAFRAGLANLLPNTTYRYTNQAVIGTDTPTTNGAGNPIYVNADGTFVRTSSTSFVTPGGYGEFTTDAAGAFEGWFMLEATGNSRFTPGNNVFMRIALNDGNAGEVAVTWLTTTASAGVINFGTGSDALQGTGIRGISTATAKDFVFLYDNEAGTGRPLYGSSIETTGVDFTTIGTYADFYETNVQGVDGSWGGIVPNVNANGVKLIVEHSFATGAVVESHTSADGVWGTTDTRNPVGGDVDILVIDLTPVGTPVLTVTPTVLNGFSYVEGAGPSAIQTYQLSGTDLQGSGNITATAPADYEVSADGTTFVAALDFPIAAGIITGQPVTVSVRLKAGLAAGSYNAETIINSGGGATDKLVTCNGTVTSTSNPELTNVTLPLYIQGINGTNLNRVPLAFRATMVNLTANTTYRFFNKIVLSSDAADYNGAGNCIYIAADGTFTRTTSTSLETPGEYGEFTTDANGSFTGWFITEPSGNDRFTPGNQLFVRISLNDGAEGTEVAARLTSTDFTTVLQFGTEADATMGTAIRGNSNDDPKDFVYLFDNIAGTGRPLCATHIETSGVDFVAAGSYAPFYSGDVAGVDGAWGGIVPNVNAAGVQRIEIRDLNDGSLTGSYNMETGIWNTTDTRNPLGGLDEVLVIDLITIGIDQPETASLSMYSAGQEIRVMTADASTHTFTLVNLQGQVVYTRQLSGSSSYELSLNLPAGIYVARVMNTQISKTQKLMIK